VNEPNRLRDAAEPNAIDAASHRDKRQPARAGRSEEQLDRFLRENRGRYTEDALKDAAIDTGYPPPMVDAALAGLRERERPSMVVKTRARAIIVGAYALTFVVLSAGMFVNEGNSGALPIVILALVMAVALPFSLLWAAGRRGAAGSLVLIIVALSMGPVGWIIGGAALLAAWWRRRNGESSSSPANLAELTLVGAIAVPTVVLLVIAGLCVASGFPLHPTRVF
jgi:hypothetical protein